MSGSGGFSAYATFFPQESCFKCKSICLFDLKNNFHFIFFLSLSLSAYRMMHFKANREIFSRPPPPPNNFRRKIYLQKKKKPKPLGRPHGSGNGLHKTLLQRD
ncbi:UNVERIFIED_CONTAM: hypothetical protein K2H54_049990 [Gekko kuhli]